ncbi:hypothetical protein RRG08_015088 [Elysia crispata]|uniref:Uncharacterized protein n=1 Tax=Elysia crispata TaxID=231223 RepID=A0AAE1B5M9_9GAST|nr:hypothetical protein RRG08_015088 [Elysia crispata]
MGGRDWRGGEERPHSEPLSGWFNFAAGLMRGRRQVSERLASLQISQHSARISALIEPFTHILEGRFTAGVYLVYFWKHPGLTCLYVVRFGDDFLVCWSGLGLTASPIVRPAPPCPRVYQQCCCYPLRPDLLLDNSLEADTTNPGNFSVTPDKALCEMALPPEGLLH